MNNNEKELLGALFSAIGTVEAAIGSTPITGIDDDVSFSLRLQGNVLQATGSALSADGQESCQSFEYVGDVIQAVGNSTVIFGLLIPLPDDLDDKLIIQGNWFQAVGSFVSIVDEQIQKGDLNQALNVIGALLQGIGNSLQAIGGILQLNEETNEKGLWIGVAGSWIQATGAILDLLVEIKEDM